MPPRRTAITTPTTPMTDAQIKALIARGVAGVTEEGKFLLLTWWNSHVRTVGHDVAYAMPWKTLKKTTIDKYCLRGEIKKLEIEMCNLKVKGTDVLSYNQCFQELAMYGRMFPEEYDEVEKYVGGLPDMIYGRVCWDSTIVKQVQVSPQWPVHCKVRKLNQGHYRSDCPELKNRNHENQTGGTKAREMVYTLGGGQNDQDLNDMEDDTNA
nr:reverse transcriptase domain-containing protein [Tanacetum cinerariifolium]